MPGRPSQRAGPSQRADDGEQASPRKSPRKKPGKKRTEEVESDEEQAETPLQDPKVKKQKVDDIIRFLLMASQTQKAVQRPDIVKNCLSKEYGQIFNELLDAAKDKLRFLFGIDVLQSEEKRGYFYLSNALRCTDFMKVGKDQSAKDALLNIILSNIFMQNPEQKEIGEDAFKRFLQKINVHFEDNRKDPVFGDAKKLITKTFVEQGWLAIRRDQSDTFGNDQIYSWGWRSRLVLSRGDMLDFVSEIMYGDGNRGRLFQEQQEIADLEDVRQQATQNGAQ